jgi:ATP-dependent Clp protease ATP-binding subunit ClpC
MYAQWAQRRGMRLDGLLDPVSGAAPFRTIAAVSGFAAYTLLRPEHGLHVLEQPRDNGRPARHRVSVRVVPQPSRPPPEGAPAHLERAEAALAAAPPPSRIARRYREEPSPLVRDAVRGYRTGRLDRVLAGDFDLL